MVNVGNIRVRNGKGNEKAEEQRNGVWTGEEIIEGRKKGGKIKEKSKLSKLVIIIRSSWHYLPLLGRTLEALGGGSEGVENSGA